MTNQGLADSSARWVRILNVDPSQLDIPAYGIVEIAGDSDDNGVFPVRMPTSDGSKMVLIVAGGNLPYQATGQASWASPIPCRYDPNDGLPVTGEVWGPAAGSWLLRKGKSGFRIFGSPGNNVVNVVRDPTAVPAYPSGYGSHPVLFGAVSWHSITALSFSVCTVTIETTTFYLSTDANGGLLLAETPVTTTASLGPFPLHGTVSITIPSQTGTFSGTVGSCSVSVSGTIPSQTVTGDLSGNTACP